MTPKARGTLEMSSAMLISGSIGLFVVLSRQPATDVVLWRCIFGCLTLLLVCLSMGLLRPGNITWRQAALAAFGGAAIVINWLMLFAAYPKASISVATTVYNVQPFMLVAMGAVVLSERVSLFKLLWMLVAFVGTIAIAQGADVGQTEQNQYVVGIGLALGAAFFYAIASIVTKRLTGVPPQLIALIQLVIGTAMLLPFATPGQLPKAPDIWAILVTLGVIHTGLMYVLLYGAIQRLPTHLTGSLSFSYPLVAVVVDLVAFGHHLTLTQVLGGSAILIAAAGSTLGWVWPWPKRWQAASH